MPNNISVLPFLTRTVFTGTQATAAIMNGIASTKKGNAKQALNIAANACTYFGYLGGDISNDAIARQQDAYINSGTRGAFKRKCQVKLFQNGIFSVLDAASTVSSFVLTAKRSAPAAASIAGTVVGASIGGVINCVIGYHTVKSDRIYQLCGAIGCGIGVGCGLLANRYGGGTAHEFNAWAQVDFLSAMGPMLATIIPISGVTENVVFAIVGLCIPNAHPQSGAGTAARPTTPGSREDVI